ncbi:hypothetical protein BDV38DRAFT_164216 [Aspergillus pseudotamarii]|uniref:Uncharacterized protein n=1 Tax=Aspergillus pseudotamarii TaxID=132259 RepID=A0A5N6SI90_ASPPS|nr:uncharacterized protein BDV38DRAFT_164216 [Aspergillus pseudotamarii]KAE8134345.1 hypothetical protein BDV38DRAFT_164216 [Aspergillus pseudotamarii]
MCVSSCPISYRCWPGGNVLGLILTMIPVDRVRSMWDALNLVKHASVLQALSRWPAAYSATVDRECLSRDWRGDVSLYARLLFSFLFFSSSSSFPLYVIFINTLQSPLLPFTPFFFLFLFCLFYSPFLSLIT